jgi:hypothetical protein
MYGVVRPGSSETSGTGSNEAETTLTDMGGGAFAPAVRACCALRSQAVRKMALTNAIVSMTGCLEWMDMEDLA